MSTASANSSSFATGAYRLGKWAAGSALLGIALSGPLAVLLVESSHPQPRWQGSAQFANYYHPIQLLPYLGGLLLVCGMLVLIASLASLAESELPVPSRASLLFGAVFAALVLFNYVVQTSFVPVLAHDHPSLESDQLSVWSMSNPKSLAWAIEMWGWAFAGVSTWLTSGIFRGNRMNAAVRWGWAVNCGVSVLGALWTTTRPGWVMSSTGLVAFALWNLLLALILTLVFKIFSARLRGLTAPESVLLSAPAQQRKLR